MKIIFFGSSDFSLPHLGKVLEEGYEIVAAVSVPPKPKGRAGALASSPLAGLARKENIPIFEPEKVRYIAEELSLLKPDIGIVASFGKIIPPGLLSLPRLGMINVHPSLLPKWRGPSPIQSALLAGEKETGITIHITAEAVDAGGILAQEKTDIFPEESYKELERRLAELGARILIETLPRLAAGEIVPQAQSEKDATYSRRFHTEDGKIEWRELAEKIFNQIRALNPEPGTFAFVEDLHGTKKRLLFPRARLELGNTSEAKGLVLQAGSGCKIAAEGGYILPLEVHIEGKKKTDIASFLKGNSWLIGKMLV
ncbi:MAG: methionyl-tRNA formyltransferase [Patescibacteria group bacterium]